MYCEMKRYAAAFYIISSVAVVVLAVKSSICAWENNKTNQYISHFMAFISIVYCVIKCYVLLEKEYKMKCCGCEMLPSLALGGQLEQRWKAI